MTGYIAELVAAADRNRRDCEMVGRAYYLCSDNLSHRNRLLGISATVASAIVGTTIFGTIQGEPNLSLKILAGLISISAAILAALQTFLNPLKESERQRIAGGKFLALKREFELYCLQYSEADEEDKKEAFAEFQKLVRDRSKLVDESPNIPDKFWNKAREEYHWPPPRTEQRPAAPPMHNSEISAG